MEIVCEDYGMQKKKLTDDAIIELQNIKWTGNIREFRNVLERLIILCGDTITGDDVKAFAQPIGR
jgi:DNA-binding NtrC family response regulator